MLKTRKRWIILIGIIIASVIAGYFFLSHDQQRLLAEEGGTFQDEFDTYLDQRRYELDASADEDADPFGEDQIVRILLIGLDSRIGVDAGHCDAIQMLEINKARDWVTLTAVPRGTYSPLPRGYYGQEGDYYVSNACAIGGLEYGVTQIERIIGKKADYVATIGFSGLLGLLRQLDLPTTDTLRWLRHRQGYGIGEPQRAHNHSTFIKQMLTKFTPDEHSRLDIPFHYLVFQLLKTDMNFSEAREISKALTEMSIHEEGNKISLFMRPEFEVRDISYDPESVSEYLDTLLGPIAHLLNNQDYSDVSTEELQYNLLALIESEKENKEFLIWAYENRLWYQVESKEERLEIQYELILAYQQTIEDLDARKEIIDAYLIEMDYLGEDDYKELALKSFGDTDELFSLE